jgi:hypothetical protein
MSDWEFVSPDEGEWELVQEGPSAINKPDTFDNVELQKAALLKEEHPYLYKAAELTSKSPALSKGIEGFANLLRPAQEAVESSGIPKFAGGALESLGNTAISVGNVPLQLADSAFGTNLRVPHLDFQKHMKEPGGLPFTAGSLSTMFAPGIGAIRGAQNIARAPGYLGVLSEILKGGAIGAATGETKEGNRGIGATLGALFGGGRGLTNRAIGEKFQRETREAMEELGERYRHVLGEGTRAGALVDVPRGANLTQATRYSSPKDRHAIEAFENNPNLETAHWAQSDLGKIVQKLMPGYRNSRLSHAQTQTLNAAMDAQRRIRGTMYNAFNQAGRPDLARDYVELTQEFAEDYAPRISPEARKMVNKLLGNPEHEEFMRRFYPELGAKETAKKIAKGVGIVAGVGTAGELARRGASHLMGD